MKRHIYAMVVAVLLPFAAKPQLFDSIRSSFSYRPSLDARFDTRNSFITARAVRVFGVKLGLDFGQTTKMGIGYNQLISDLEKEIRVSGEGSKMEIVEGKLKFAFIAPYFEYTFHKKGKWEISIPVQVGVGFARYEYENKPGEQMHTNRSPMVLYEPAMTVQYRFIRYMGIGVGSGYRLVFMDTSAVQENFNSPVYLLKLKLFLGDAYRDLFPARDQ